MSNEISVVRPVGTPKQADQKFCHACAALMHVDAASCPSCAAPQVENTQTAPSALISNAGQRSIISGQVFCSGCGNAIHSSATSCPHCGAVSSSAGKASSKNRITAALFALLLGGIGAHKFYLGNVLLGLLYLLFSWTFIPLVVSFIEALILFSQSDEDFARRHP